MSSLIFNARVIATGTIIESEDRFAVGDALYFKSVFSAAEVVNQDPPNAGQWLYINGQFVPYVEPNNRADVPQSITPRQARLALLGAGLLEQIQAAFATLPEPQRTAASIEWEYASSIERSSPLVSQMAAVAGLTDEQVDELFAAGAAL
jgi:hypothetical protein